MLLLVLGSYSLSVILWVSMVYLLQRFKNRVRMLKDVMDLNSREIFRHALMPAAASILNWACISLTAYILLGTLDVNISISRVVFAVCIAMLSVLLPVSLNGWGIREAAYVWALSPFSEPSVSIMFSITFAIIGTYSLALLGLIFELCARESRLP